MVHISILGLHEKVVRDLIFTSLSQLFQENPLCHFFLYLSRYEHMWVPKALISRDMVISGTTPLASQDLGSSLSRYGHIWGPTPVTLGSWLFFQEDLKPYFLLYQQKENLKGENNLPALSI